MKLPYQKTAFMLSAAKPSQFPVDVGAEVAFIGRSNAGKSSALNCITQQKSLAKTSKTPGRTQLVNFFEVTGGARLVDLPGYGYAKVAKSMKQQWQQLIDQYLAMRNSLTGVVLIMDIRHPLKDIDRDLIDWAIVSNLPTLILLTKSDKLKFGAAKKTLLEVRSKMQEYQNIQVQLFSSVKRDGLDECRQLLDQWLENGLLTE